MTGKLDPTKNPTIAANTAQSRERDTAPAPKRDRAPDKAAATSNSGKSGKPGNSGRLYTHVVYVRVTEAEWKLLHRRAAHFALSLSRFMVRSAMRQNTRTAGLTTPDERARLERVLFQFHHAALSLRQLSALRLIETAGGSDVVEQLRETAGLLDRLCHDLQARLRNSGSSASSSQGREAKDGKEPVGNR